MQYSSISTPAATCTMDQPDSSNTVAGYTCVAGSIPCVIGPANNAPIEASASNTAAAPHAWNAIILSRRLQARAASVVSQAPSPVASAMDGHPLPGPTADAVAKSSWMVQKYR